jgi:hypothetical protein
MFMADGGIQGGIAFGQTDPIGYYVTDGYVTYGYYVTGNAVTPRGLQATLLHLLGFDPYRFGVEYQGLFVQSIDRAH